MPIWEEIPGRTKEDYGEIISLSWLGNVLVSPRRVGGCGLGKERLDLPAQAVATATWTQISGRKRNKMNMM